MFRIAAIMLLALSSGKSLAQELITIPDARLFTPPPNPGVLGRQPTEKQIELGKKLFFDPRLSRDGTVSCSTCHHPSRGWSDARPVAIGINGQAGTRNSPTIINSVYSRQMFWDGRAVGLTTQALLPLVNPIEMGNRSQDDVVNRLRTSPGYTVLFTEAFGIDPIQRSSITQFNLAFAIAAFETTITSFNAPIDRRMAGDEQALSPDAEIGFQIFLKANCTQCHVPPLYTDNLLHNNGMEFAGKFNVTDPGQFAEVPRSARYANTVRAFKTPTLREIHRTAPYNHAGNFFTLERVVTHYASGGKRFDGKVDRYMDRRIKPLNLSKTQQEYLVIFLKEAFASDNYPTVMEPGLP